MGNKHWYSKQAYKQRLYKSELVIFLDDGHIETFLVENLEIKNPKKIWGKFYRWYSYNQTSQCFSMETSRGVFGVSRSHIVKFDMIVMEQ